MDAASASLEANRQARLEREFREVAAFYFEAAASPCRGQREARLQSLNTYIVRADAI
jgi:hypothetical protein